MYNKSFRKSFIFIQFFTRFDTIFLYFDINTPIMYLKLILSAENNHIEVRLRSVEQDDLGP